MLNSKDCRKFSQFQIKYNPTKKLYCYKNYNEHVAIYLQLEEHDDILKYEKINLPQILKLHLSIKSKFHVNKFTKGSQVSKYETRRVNDLQVPRPMLEMLDRVCRIKVLRCGMISQTI